MSCIYIVDQSHVMPKERMPRVTHRKQTCFAKSLRMWPGARDWGGWVWPHNIEDEEEGRSECVCV